MSRTRTFLWHQRFKEGHEEVKDDSRSERPSTSKTEVNIERAKLVVGGGDRKLTLRMIASKLKMKKVSVWRIFTQNLSMQKICQKMVLRILKDDQKKHCMIVCSVIIEHLQTEPDLLRRITTGNDTCIFEYDLENKLQRPLVGFMVYQPL